MNRDRRDLRTIEGRIDRYLDAAENRAFWRPFIYLERLDDSSNVARETAARMVSGWIRWLSSLSRAYARGRMNEAQTARFLRIAQEARPYLKRAMSAGFSVHQHLLDASRP
jgi:hypothetical protein